MEASNILTILIPQGAGAPTIDWPLLMQCGHIKMSIIKAHALTYVQTINSCQVHSNMMLYTCILKSLTKEGRKKITSEPKSNHTLTKNVIMLFKFLMNEAVVDQRTTTRLYHNNLMPPEVHMEVVNRNIEQFNQFVRQQARIEKLKPWHRQGWHGRAPPAGIPCHTREQVQWSCYTAANKHQWWNKHLEWVAHVQSFQFLQAA